MREGDLAVGIWAACDVADWLGRGAQDLLVSCWEGCYEGGVYIFRSDGRNPDGTPSLLPGEMLPGVGGFVSAAPFGRSGVSLVSASRRTNRYLLYPNAGASGRPRMGQPQELRAAGKHSGTLWAFLRILEGMEGRRRSATHVYDGPPDCGY